MSVPVFRKRLKTHLFGHFSPQFAVVPVQLLCHFVFFIYLLTCTPVAPVVIVRWVSAYLASDEHWSCRVCGTMQCALHLRELHVVSMHVVQQRTTALCWVQFVHCFVSIWTMSRVDNAYFQMPRFGFAYNKHIIHLMAICMLDWQPNDMPMNEMI